MPVESSIPAATGTGPGVDVFQLPDGKRRQANIIGDPSLNEAVAAVSNADPGPTDYGLVVRDPNAPTARTRLGALPETEPASDTASSGLNGRLQRIAQRLASLIALLPTALGAGGGLKVDG